MKINDEIRNDLDVIGLLVVNSFYYFDNLDILANNLEPEEKKSFESFPFLRKMRISLWSLIILDLHKLLSTNANDKYRFQSFINRLENNYRNIEWKNKLEIEEIRNILIKISDANNEIQKIKDLRDNRIAHHDEITQITKLDLKELKTVMDLCKDIHDKFNFSLNNATTHWSFSHSETLSPVIKILTKFRKIHELTLTYLGANNVTIQIDELLKIIRASS